MCNARYYVADHLSYACELKEHAPGVMHQATVYWGGNDGHPPTLDELRLIMESFGVTIDVPADGSPLTIRPEQLRRNESD